MVELRQGQRPALHLPTVQPNQRLEVTLIGDPHAAEVAVNLLPPRIGEDLAQRGRGQTPPLRAQMGLQPRRHGAGEAQRPLQIHPSVEQSPLGAKAKGKAQRKPLMVEPALGPSDVVDGHALNEIRTRLCLKMRHQVRHRPQRQAGPRGEQNMAHLRPGDQHLLRGVDGRTDDPPHAPVAGVAPLDKAHLLHIAQGRAQRHVVRPRHLGIGMDDHRAAARRKVPRDLRRPVQRRVHQHDDAQAHAHVPFEIRPRISNCRQLMYRSDHGVHSAAPAPSR